MKSVFADSFHFLALLNRDDAAHGKAVEFELQLWHRVVTTDCVLLEVGDALCDPRDREDFVRFYETVSTDRRTSIIRLSPQLLERGLELFRNRADKSWPLTDCISFVVMTDEGIGEALTGDEHFTQAGFKALLAAV